MLVVALNGRFFQSLWPHYSEEKECQPSQYILDEVGASMLSINLNFPHVLQLCNTTGYHVVEQQPWKPAAGSAQGLRQELLLSPEDRELTRVTNTALGRQKQVDI